MSKNLPYLATPSLIKKCLERIKEAATPPRVTKDFVNNVIQIKGGQSSAIVPFLKKIGLVSSDGTPTELYKTYRNQSEGNKAIAEAIRIGYKPLFENNETFYKLNDTQLKDCIISVTGLDKDDSIFKLTFSTLKNILNFASFDQIENIENKEDLDLYTSEVDSNIELQSKNIVHTGLNLSYTINLNLPATTDQSVFNAIFKSLKEYLLANGK